jgi:hypothetical protein
MNIGRTIRVFRAEPVVGPLPAPPPDEPPERPVVTAEEPVEAAPAVVPARLGG